MNRSWITLRFGAAIAACLLLTHPGSAARGDPPCVNWRQRSSADSPAARGGHAMAYESARGVTVLFGGWNNGPFGDTWEWNGTTWTQRSPATSPPERFMHAMAYDSVRSKTVLFGGTPDFSIFLGDTSEWDGTDWTQGSPAASPSARDAHAMAYDSVRGVTILFGGLDGSGHVNDTWEWDGTNWTQHSPATSPSARFHHAMAYDSVRGVTVLFGGTTYGASDFLSDTWEWDGTNWRQRVPATSPPARRLHAMVYDSTRGVTVLFGGDYVDGSGNDFLFDDTWEWNGTDWAQRSPATSPQARLGHAMAYDSVRGVTVLFDYDTWEFGVFSLDADVNVDCRADGLDIAPFVAALLTASTDASDLFHADFNANGVIDLGDVPGFTQKLLGL
jgi:hypothetical protein